MTTPPIWDQTIVEEEDRYFSELKWSGQIPSNSRLICSTTKSSNSFISSILGNLKPIGVIDEVINEVLNAFEYVNGAPPNTKISKVIHHDVFLFNDTIFISFAEIGSNPNILIKFVFETFKPTDLIILNSVHESLYHSKLEVIPSLFTLSTYEPNTVAAPNILSGIPAGFLTYSDAYKVKCSVYLIVEDNSGSSLKSMNLWSHIIAPLLNLNESELAYKAAKKDAYSRADLNTLYS